MRRSELMTIKEQVSGIKKMAIYVVFRILKIISCMEARNWKRFPKVRR